MRAEYDSATNRLMLFGGAWAYVYGVNEVWVLANANGLTGTPSWSQLAPIGAAPAGRAQYFSAFDSNSNRLVVFGGSNDHDCGTGMNDLWILSNANGLGGGPAWTRLIDNDAPGSPPRISAGASIYDAVANELTIIGGQINGCHVGGGIDETSEVWTLSNANGLGGTPAWTKRLPSGGPPQPRVGHTAVYDPLSRRIAVFSGAWFDPGNVYGYFTDTWVLSPEMPPTDIQPPVIAPTVVGTPGSNGWYRGDVAVSWSISDPESPVTSTSGCGTTTLTPDTPGVTLTCTATSAGGTATQSVTVKIDATRPSLTASRAPAPNAAGWSNTDVTVSFGCTDNLSAVASQSGPASVTAEGINQSVTGNCTDLAGNTAFLAVSGINIDKTAPLTSNVLAIPNPVQLNGGVTLSGDLSDAGGSNLASAAYAVNNVPGGTIAASGASAYVSTALAPFASTGVYQVCLRAQDVAGNASGYECLFLPVYDPNGGFVTGGGWIASPPGAYTPDPTLNGKATFGFVSKYQPGAAVPGGSTQFQFHAAGMKFQSTAYEWLVIAGARAQYKGTGTINGTGTYRFLLTAIDGDQPGGGGADRFRIKIWADGGIIYDNQMGADDQSDPTTTLGGGSIVIHRE